MPHISLGTLPYSIATLICCSAAFSAPHFRLEAGYCCGFRPREVSCKPLDACVFAAIDRRLNSNFWGRSAKSEQWQCIPTRLSIEQFQQFVLHFGIGSRALAETTLHAVFNYILQSLYLGCQWKKLPIEKDPRRPPRNSLHALYGHSKVAKRMLFEASCRLC